VEGSSGILCRGSGRFFLLARKLGEGRFVHSHPVPRRFFRTPHIGVTLLQSVEDAPVSRRFLECLLGCLDPFVGLPANVGGEHQPFVERGENRAKLLEMANSRFAARGAVHMGVRVGAQGGNGLPRLLGLFRHVLRGRELAGLRLFVLFAQLEEAL
jgi:hypothetical protein